MVIPKTFIIFVSTKQKDMKTQPFKRIIANVDDEVILNTTDLFEYVAFVQSLYKENEKDSEHKPQFPTNSERADKYLAEYCGDTRLVNLYDVILTYLVNASRDVELEYPETKNKYFDNVVAQSEAEALQIAKDQFKRSVWESDVNEA